jgi:hypothetical protein
MTTLTPEDPKAYILAHDKRVRQLDRMGASQLSAIYSDALGSALIHAGPMDHDELVNAIVAVEFPKANAAREAYAQPLKPDLASDLLASLRAAPLPPASRKAE